MSDPEDYRRLEEILRDGRKKWGEAGSRLDEINSLLSDPEDYRRLEEALRDGRKKWGEAGSRPDEINSLLSDPRDCQSREDALQASKHDWAESIEMDFDELSHDDSELSTKAPDPNGNKFREKQMVTLNVGGHLITTTIATLTRFPDTMLGTMFSDPYALMQDTNGAYFIDRDGTHFREILNFLRGSTVSSNVSCMAQLTLKEFEELKVEADYYGLKDLMFPEPLACQSWKAESEVIKSRAGFDSTVTQGDDKLWYIEHPRIGAPRLVTVCDHCGVGYISHKIFWDSYLSFTTGRTIKKNQPRPCGTCPRCNDW